MRVEDHHTFLWFRLVRTPRGDSGTLGQAMIMCFLCKSEILQQSPILGSYFDHIGHNHPCAKIGYRDAPVSLAMGL